MKSIKNIIAKKTIKFKIIESLKGKLTIKIDTVFKAKDELNSYDYLLKRIPNIINGINEVSLNYKDLVVIINYDDKKINEERILEILEISKELVIDNLEYIEDNYEENLEEMLKIMEEKLKLKLIK